MDIWWLHALTFIFGYVTCKTFYFLRATRISLKLLKSARVTYLLMATRAIEQYLTAAGTMKYYLEESQAAESVSQSFDLRFNVELDQFRENVVQNLLHLTPPTFRENLPIKNWSSAMEYLEANKLEALAFWRIDR